MTFGTLGSGALGSGRARLITGTHHPTTEYRFKVRAVTKGTFAVPPLSAEGMYDPEVRFVGETPPPLVIR